MVPDNNLLCNLCKRKWKKRRGGIANEPLEKLDQRRTCHLYKKQRYETNIIMYYILSSKMMLTVLAIVLFF